MGERLHREFQRQVEGRVAGQRGLLYLAGGACAGGALQADFHSGSVPHISLGYRPPACPETLLPADPVPVPGYAGTNDQTGCIKLLRGYALTKEKSKRFVKHRGGLFVEKDGWYVKLKVASIIGELYYKTNHHHRFLSWQNKRNRAHATLFNGRIAHLRSVGDSGE